MLTDTQQPTARPGFWAKARHHNLATQEAIAGYLFLAPWIIGLIIFTIAPIVASFVLSFTHWDIVNPPEWASLYNYNRIFTVDKDFRQALQVTLTYALFTIPLGIAAGLGLSLLLNQRLRGMNIFRTLFYLPAILPAVAVTLLWVWMFNSDFGLINWFLGMFGVEGPHWFQSPRWVLPALTIMSLWGVGGGAVIYLAGLQNISPHLYEAAEIDGAGGWHKFLNITLPLLSPTIFFQLIMSLIGTLQSFVTTFVAFGGLAAPGGPQKSALFYMLYLYIKAFREFKMGYASALAWILSVLILLLTLVVFGTSKRWVYYEAEK
ncbi:MAG: sugar ABC transporter permease [Anaerolineales bacterium]|nr:sugar ABC transporter permease [Anaerolineales bacterium]